MDIPFDKVLEVLAVKFVDLLVTFARDRQATIKKEGSAKIRQTIEEVTSTVTNMVAGFDDATPSQREFWLAELRAMYDKVSTLVPVGQGQRYNSQADWLVNMISSARIYYWLRTWNGQRTLDGMTADDLTVELKRPDITRSQAATVKRILQEMVNTRSTRAAIGLAKTRCLQVIVEAKRALSEPLE